MMPSIDGRHFTLNVEYRNHNVPIRKKKQRALVGKRAYGEAG